MSKNFLTKLKNKGSLNLRVIPIYRDDKNYLSLENFLKNQVFLNFNEIEDILKINFDRDKPLGYILIKDEKNIEGFLGTIFSKRQINGEIVEHCYLHSWIVSKKHRFEAFKLIMPIIEKNIFLSTYSPIKSLEGVYKKLGFEGVEFSSKIVLSFSFIGFEKNNVFFSEEKSLFKEFLSNKETKILDDHMTTNTKKIFIYFDNNKEDNLFLIVKRKTKKFFFTFLDIIYISNLNKFKLHEKKISLKLFKKFKTVFLKTNVLDSNDIFINHYLVKNIKKKVYYLNKPSNFKFDILYSELLR